MQFHGYVIPPDDNVACDFRLQEMLAAIQQGKQ